MKLLALGLVCGGGSALMSAPRRSASVSRLRSPLHATYDLAEVERALMTERDACGTGFVAETMPGAKASRRVVELALTACECVEHRGACSADDVSGDGAGVLTMIPWAVYEADTPAVHAARAEGRALGAVMLFLPQSAEGAVAARAVAESAAYGAGFELVGWRAVPVNAQLLGHAAQEGCPTIEQLFVAQDKARAPGSSDWTDKALERALYLLRRSISGTWRSEPRTEELYVASCSSKTIVHKAMVQAKALRRFYLDLDDSRFESTFAMYHRRFSTNTMPRWSLAQPFRLLCHNGEINTLRGNVNWMAARAKAAGDDLGVIAAGCRDLIADSGSPSPSGRGGVPEGACAYVDANGLGPVVDASYSDSANLDSACELYSRAGRSVAEALMLMTPPALATVKAEDLPFFELHAPLQEPWDGPACMCFGDGELVGARLDRNGLRPARYSLYVDGLLTLSSETGSSAVAGEKWLPADSELARKGRLGPGESCVVDLKTGGFYDDAAVRRRVSAKPKWRAALNAQRRTLIEPMLSLDDESSSHEYADAALPFRYGRASSDVADAFARARRQAAFGWGLEDVSMQVESMVTGKESNYCMGADAPIAALSKYAHPLYNYFKQRHAQVTNPPIDALREGHVMSLECWLGERSNCVEVALEDDLEAPVQDGTRLARIASPVLRAAELDQVKTALGTSETVQTTYDASNGAQLEQALRALEKRVVESVQRGARLVVLSDANFDPFAEHPLAYVPPLLAVGAAHHALIDAGLRLKASIVVETAQCWSTHHVACLVGYGASAVHPYLLFETADDFARAAFAKESPEEASALEQDAVAFKAVSNVRDALDAGVLKILSKMGISALASYHGAQIFEVVGLADQVVQAAFKGTPSRIGGMNLAELEKETSSFVAAATQTDDFLKASSAEAKRLAVFRLSNYGFNNARKNAETHANTPAVARLLHAAVREDDDELRLEKFLAFENALRRAAPFGVRDLVDLVQVESQKKDDAVALRSRGAEESAILRRFVTGGMSLGALSRETHETLAIAMNRVGGASNSGEGGEDLARSAAIRLEDRFSTWKHLTGESVVEGDSATSAIKQVASGRFGVTTAYLATATQLEIKVAQGAKPGEGGQLPGAKVDSYIASIRAATVGVTLISPPPHHDVYSIEDLSQLIFDLKAVNPTARVSVKLVAIAGIGTVACGVAKAGADVVQISGHDGGTGAAALSSIKHAGAPLELGLAEVHLQLLENGLRDRVTLRVDGGVRTSMDVVKLALLGAEEFGFGTVAMVAAGCVMARVCHENTCPVGVATQQPHLRARARTEPRDVQRYFELVASGARRIVTEQLGLASFADAVGRSDLLRAVDVQSELFSASSLNGGKDNNNNEALDSKAPWPKMSKTKGLDASFVLRRADASAPDFVVPDTPNAPRALLAPDGAHFDDALVHDLESSCESSSSWPGVADNEQRVIVNVDRAVGTRLAGAIARRRREDPEFAPQVSLKFRGSAGQSFGAFALDGMWLELEGDANDYVGKGLCGATLAIRPPLEAEENGIFVAATSVLVGNVALYGATRGALFSAGVAGERFGVRNSGADAVVEGAGDHLCEYMTRGTVAVLGTTGINVGAGMTGGVAFLLADDHDHDATQLTRRINQETVRVSKPDAHDLEQLKTLLARHQTATNSRKATALLNDWPTAQTKFWKVAPPQTAKKNDQTKQPAAVEQLNKVKA